MFVSFLYYFCFYDAEKYFSVFRSYSSVFKDQSRLCSEVELGTNEAGQMQDKFLNASTVLQWPLIFL